MKLFYFGHRGYDLLGASAGAGNHDLTARAHGGGGPALRVGAFLLLALDLGGEAFALRDGTVRDEESRRAGTDRNDAAGVPLRAGGDDAEVEANPDDVFGGEGKAAELEIADGLTGGHGLAEEEDGEQGDGEFGEVAADKENLTACALLIERLWVGAGIADAGGDLEEGLLAQVKGGRNLEVQARGGGAGWTEANPHGAWPRRVR